MPASFRDPDFHLEYHCTFFSGSQSWWPSQVQDIFSDLVLEGKFAGCARVTPDSYQVADSEIFHASLILMSSFQDLRDRFVFIPTNFYLFLSERGREQSSGEAGGFQAQTDQGFTAAIA